MARQKQKQKQQQSVKVVVNVGKKERRSKSQRKRRVERRKVEEVPQGIMLNRFVPPIPMSQGFQPQAQAQAQPDFLQQFLKVMAGLDQPTKKDSIGIQAQIPEKKLKSESDLKEEAKISREKAQLSQQETQSFSSGEPRQMPYQAGLPQEEMFSGRYIIPRDVATSLDPFRRERQASQASEASSSIKRRVPQVREFPPGWDPYIYGFERQVKPLQQQASEASSSGLPPVRSTQSALVKRSKDGK